MALTALLAAVLTGPGAGAAGPEASLIVVADDAAAQAAIATLDRRVNVRAAEAVEPSEDLSTVEVAAADVDEALALLNADPRVEYAEMNHPVWAAETPSDPLYDWQLPKVKADGVWDTTMGRTSTVIAVIDTGVNTAHPDFAGTAFADGWNAILQDDEAPYDDDHGHGTSVAGIIGAQHNTIGTAGVCPRCTIMPIKALDKDGNGTYASVIAAMDYAVTHGADVINLSLAGTGTSANLQAAVGRAATAGVLVVAAAGNTGADPDPTKHTARHYPAAYEPVLAVAASNELDQRNSSSTYGSDWVDVAAPGCNPAPRMDGGYREQFCGTSSAAPVVAGVAGLLHSSVAGGALLNTTLRATAVPVPDNYVGSGRIHAAEALLDLDINAPEVSITSPAAGWASGAVEVVAQADDDYGVRKVEFLVDDVVSQTVIAPPFEGVIPAEDLPEGTLSLQARATDTVGLTTLSSPVQIQIDNTAPAVAITAPQPAATVSGNTTLAATASDVAAGMQHVRFLVDGALVATDSTAPYTAAFNSATVDDGEHQLRVTATDAAGNSTTAEQVFSVVNEGVAPPSGGGGGGGGGGGALPPPPTEEPTADPTEPTTTDGDGTLTADVEAGGAVATDPDDTGPTADEPLHVALTSPVAGSVSITRDDSVGVPAGYSVAGLQATITAPAATANAPLQLSFDVHDSALPEGRQDAELVLFRNGVPVPACSADDGTATPDPCVAEQTHDGDAHTIRVLTSRASTWAMGVAATACTTATSAGFGDTAGNPHATAIDCAVARDIVGGVDADSYAPRADVTRAQMATFIANTILSAGARLPAGPDAFDDDGASVHHAAINRLAAAGIVGGVTPSRYDPRSPVSREQMATFLVRAHDYVAAQELAAGPDAFDDDDGRAHEANIDKAAAAGLAAGLSPTEFGPTQQVRRDQLATFVVRLLDRLVAAGDAD